MSAKKPLLLLAALLVACSAGCSSDVPESTDSAKAASETTQDATASSDSEAPSGSQGTAPRNHNEQGPDIAPTGPLPTEWDEQSVKSALETATKAMELYARPHLDQETWWDDLAPMLGDQARMLYAYVEPRAVHATRVTGKAKITDDSSTLLVYVTVPTNVGDYQVMLNRIDANSPWEVALFILPEGLH